jgi:hypothetical protein
MTKRIIGLTGKKGCGKSTVADYLQSSWLYGQYAFADPLKSGLFEMFGVSYNSLYGTETQKNEVDPFWNVSGRQLAQVVGTELFRDYLPTLLPSLHNIWIRRMEKTLLTSPFSYIVISDVRFGDEAAFIRAQGGLIIQITRNYPPPDLHSSENQTIAADYTIDNDTTIKELHRKVDSLMRELNN